MTKKKISIILSILMVFSVLGAYQWNTSDAYASDSEMKGLWVGFCDFSTAGLKYTNATTYRKNVETMLDKAEKLGTNTIFFHTRAFHDATYPSKKFSASNYMTVEGGTGLAVFDDYDPLQIVIDEAHSRGMDVQAWMNPYRVTYYTFLDPAKDSSTKDILTAVDEVMKYDIDGIHFDDYFYHSKSKYKDQDTGKKYTVNISASEKRSNVNKMIRTVYSHIKAKDKNMSFGISPQGNYDNDMNAGADVKTWLSHSGYVDYVIPQIYWTNTYGSDDDITMYTNRLNQFKNLLKNDAKMYVGLALYRTGKSYSDDHGWQYSGDIMVDQIKELRTKNLDGYVLFSASNLYNKESSTERANLIKYINPVKESSISFTKSSVTLESGKTYTTKLNWSPTNVTSKSVKYKSSKSSIAYVKSSGKIYAKAPGTATITATSKYGKTSKIKVTVKEADVKVIHRTQTRNGSSSSTSKTEILDVGDKVTIIYSRGVWRKMKETGNWVYYKRLEY